MPDIEKRLETVEDVLEKLIACLRSELGEDRCLKLLHRLNNPPEEE